MNYIFSSVCEELRKNPAVKFLDTVPRCPKNADLDCVKKQADCKQGKSIECKQKISFFVDEKSLKILYPKFYVVIDKKFQGIIRDSDISILWLIKKGIINKENLIEISTEA